METIAAGAAGSAPTFHAASACGRGRSAVVCGPTWFAIAGGIGGATGDQDAGRIAVDCLVADGAPVSLDGLADCLGRVDAAVRSAARRTAAVGLAGTLVVAVPSGDGIAIAHVGGARCYRFDGGELTLLTHDHSYVQELVDLGRLTVDEARDHRLRRLVTRALGIDGTAGPDISLLPRPVGRLLLCSDGLAAGLSPTAIRRVLAGAGDPGSTARRLVGLASAVTADADLAALVLDDPPGPGGLPGGRS